MSLQHAAKHLAAHGRGKDTELIHMDKGEIASLQQIAMAHGGSLTINPQTGLPEAGFLSAIMPMVAGAALTGLSGGVINPMTAGFMVGGLRTAQSGSLKKGIMAGFGAYGGAGLAQSFGAAGASSVPTATPVTPTAAPEAFAGSSYPATTPGTPIPDGVPIQGTPLAPMTGAPPVSNYPQYGDPRLQSAYNSAVPTSAPPVQPVQATNYRDAFADAGFEGSGRPPTTSLSFKDMNVSQRLEAMKSGASFENAGNYIAAKPYTSLAAATQVASDMRKDPAKPAEPDRDMGQRYSFTGGKLEPTPAPDVPTYEDMLTKQDNFGRQRQYFNSPTYSPISKDAAKNLYNFADGGPVERMSNNAAMGANTMYPMANTATSSFATPYQAPQSTNMLANMVAPSGGGAVNAMSGEPSMQGTRMAEGGEAEGAVAESRPSYTYDPQTRKYTAGSSMGGASNQPQDFGASAAAALDNFSAGVARDGMTTPMGSYIPPSSNGIPSYAYNPQTRQYIQMAGGGISGNINFDAPQSSNAGPLEQLIRAIHAKQAGGGPMEDAKKYEYNPEQQQYVQQQASGGLSDARYNLGGYSDGGRLLRGPGDGVSDSIPAVIGKKQPARLADGEFVVPARIVSELGNGSTEAGARKLYAMMDRIQSARKKTVGKDKVAHNSRSSKYLPA